MPYDAQLATRVRQIFAARRVAFSEKRMMGGVCFMVDGKMCIGVEKDRLMARIGADAYDSALKRRGCVRMDFTGKSMRGFVFVNPEGTSSKRDLASWIALALKFNPIAPRSKRRKRNTAKARRTRK